MPRTRRTIYDAVASEINKLRPEWEMEACHDQMCFAEGVSEDCIISVGTVNGPWGVSVTRIVAEDNVLAENRDTRFTSERIADARHIAASCVAFADEMMQEFASA